jgi:MFS family permease
MHELLWSADCSLWRMCHCHHCELRSMFCAQYWRWVIVVSALRLIQGLKYPLAFIAGRALVGIGQGFVLPCGPTFISETAPADIRGRIMSMWQGMPKLLAFITCYRTYTCFSFFSVLFTIGSFIVYWISYGTKLSTAPLGLWRFRIVLICQCFLPMIICVGIASLPP